MKRQIIPTLKEIEEAQESISELRILTRRLRAEALVAYRDHHDKEGQKRTENTAALASQKIESLEETLEIWYTRIKAIERRGENLMGLDGLIERRDEINRMIGQLKTGENN